MAKFSRGPEGQKHTICLKNTLKDTIFLKKVEKTYHLAGQGAGGGAGAEGGQGPPFVLPCGRPWKAFKMWQIKRYVKTELFSSFLSNFIKKYDKN
jgi:hypothetical protein